MVKVDEREWKKWKEGENKEAYEVLIGIEQVEGVGLSRKEEETRNQLDIIIRDLLNCPERAFSQ